MPKSSLVFPPTRVIAIYDLHGAKSHSPQISKGSTVSKVVSFSANKSPCDPCPPRCKKSHPTNFKGLNRLKGRQFFRQQESLRSMPSKVLRVTADKILMAQPSQSSSVSPSTRVLAIHDLKGPKGHSPQSSKGLTVSKVVSFSANKVLPIHALHGAKSHSPKSSKGLIA